MRRVVVDGVVHEGDFTQEFIDGIACSGVVKYHFVETAQEHIIVSGEIDWDSYNEYTLGPAYSNANLLDVRDADGLRNYIDLCIDDVPFQEHKKYLATLHFTAVETGGWERIISETDIFTFDNLEFIIGVKAGLKWLTRTTRIEIIDTESFLPVTLA